MDGARARARAARAPCVLRARACVAGVCRATAVRRTNGTCSLIMHCHRTAFAARHARGTPGGAAAGKGSIISLSSDVSHLLSSDSRAYSYQTTDTKSSIIELWISRARSSSMSLVWYAVCNARVALWRQAGVFSRFLYYLSLLICARAAPAWLRARMWRAHARVGFCAGAFSRRCACGKGRTTPLFFGAFHRHCARAHLLLLRTRTGQKNCSSLLL